MSAKIISNNVPPRTLKTSWWDTLPKSIQDGFMKYPDSSFLRECLHGIFAVCPQGATKTGKELIKWLEETPAIGPGPAVPVIPQPSPDGTLEVAFEEALMVRGAEYWTRRDTRFCVAPIDLNTLVGLDDADIMTTVEEVLRDLDTCNYEVDYSEGDNDYIDSDVTDQETDDIFIRRPELERVIAAVRKYEQERKEEEAEKETVEEETKRG